MPETFAKFFHEKIKTLSGGINIEEGVYNGVKKVNPENKMFMDRNSIRDCITSIKLKNTEGFDRIPQRILVDGVDQLLDSFVGLFNRIYNQTSVPAQWLISKTIPIYILCPIFRPR